MRSLLIICLLAAPALPAPVELKPFEPVDTAAGKLVRREVLGEEHPLRLLLNGEQLVYQRDGTLELSYLIPQATTEGADAVLVAVGSDLPAEKACTHYLFAIVPKEGAASTTSEFGDCTDRFSVQREGPAITVRFAESDKAWTLQDGKLVEEVPAPKKAPKGKGRGKSGSSSAK